MDVGQTVYTVNNKTGEVDTWTYRGALRTPKELLAHLVSGKKCMFLPVRCVFESKRQAERIAKS